MNRKVSVIDYGIGNLLSVYRAFAACGADVTLIERPEEIVAADRLVLPGVGAFADGMKGLSERGLVEPIREYAMTGRPLIGICLGMQMLLERTEEFGDHEGLGLIRGHVAEISREGNHGAHKIPHIGWNGLLRPESRETWDGTLLQGTKEGESVYFVHSFTAVPDDPKDRLADADYDGCTISATIQRDNVMGCQFHPEKSATAGLRIVSSFMELN